MTVARWDDLRQRAVDAFGAFPSRADEGPLVEAFQRSPAAVENALGRVVDRYRAGKVTSPWRIWAMECKPGPDVMVQTGPDRERYALRAEGWVRNVGAQYDRESEVVDELFGERGMLRAWPELEPRVLGVWRTVRQG